MAKRAYVFDAYGTLFDVHSAVGRLRDQVGPQAERLSQLWRTKQLEHSWIRALAGRHRPFWQVTGDALDYAIAATGGHVGKELRDDLLNAYLALDAYPEVLEVLGELKASGAKLAVLSNGSPDMLNAAVKSAGLDILLDDAFSIEEVGVYKPAPGVYEIVCRHYDMAPGEVAFQSSNRWDIAGAKAFGFDCTWINRFAAPDEFPDMPADRIASDLRALLPV